VMILALAACGGGGEPGSSAAENSVPGSAAAAGDTGAETESGAGDTVPAAGDVSTSGLAENFDGALTIMAQLALGTVQLDDTDLAVDKAQAAELLPLWQALQSLSQSDTTAEIELQAVVKQISNTMTPEQIAAIASMKLTEDRVTELLQSGELGFSGFGRGAGAQGGSGNGRGFGGFGPPGGEFPGGGPGGFGGPGGGNFSEEDLATRRARFEGGGITEFQDRMLTGMVVRLLQDKLGIVSERQLQANIMNEAFMAVAGAAGLSEEALREQMAAGQSLAEIVEGNSGDVSALQASLEEIFGGLPNAADLDLPQATADWLGIAAGS
jgi:hypothetical protein